MQGRRRRESSPGSASRYAGVGHQALMTLQRADCLVAASSRNLGIALVINDIAHSSSRRSLVCMTLEYAYTR